jgi:phosphatidylserine/phosphatidylglycerophosphate/cardiolipin synthase-like enzyme
LAVVLTSQLNAGASARSGASVAERAPQAQLSQTAPGGVAARTAAAGPRYRPAPGVTFNTPGDQSINNKVLRAIRHTWKRYKIRAMTWNLNSWVFVRALREAHERGVSVRLIMSRRLAREQGPGGPFRTLQRALEKGSRGRPEQYRSWARTCENSCRGRRGAMHTKMYVFSQSGAQRRVVMSSSANLTGSAAGNQYNDMFTVTGNKVPYRRSIAVFNQAAQDRPAAPIVYKSGALRGWFQPRFNRVDLPLRMLDQVRCHGARGAGIRGRTSVRIAQDVILGNRGIRLARKIRELDRHGCNIRLVYSQLGGKVWQILRNVPRNHLVQDRDGDGAYDVYLHMKAMAISGRYGNRRGVRIVYQGSENWSGLAKQSDEQGLIIKRDGVERQYGRQINRLFGIHLVSVSARPSQPQAKNPYVNMER